MHPLSLRARAARRRGTRARGWFETLDALDTDLPLLCDCDPAFGHTCEACEPDTARAA